MKKENFDIAKWALDTRDAIIRTKRSLSVTENNEVKKSFINRILNIVNDAITKIENELEELN